MQFYCEIVFDLQNNIRLMQIQDSRWQEKNYMAKFYSNMIIVCDSRLHHSYRCCLQLDGFLMFLSVLSEMLVYRGISSLYQKSLVIFPEMS